MSAQYQFLPWVRAGAARSYLNADTEQPVLAREDRESLTALPVTLTVNDRPPLGVALRLYGPGDVAGIDARAVIRTDPPPHSTDLEPNHLACVEFDTPDFPWMFTPAAARSQGRLRPWLCLVVVRSGDAATLTFTPDRPLPVLTAPVEELPDLGESWAWAHAQVVQADASEAVDHILASVPQRNLSRLLCPRRLAPHTAYLACVVPTFDAGRRAGLGREVGAQDDIELAPAWDGAQASVELPVYHHWEFATGAGGDFESLAELLEGRVTGDVGRRPLRAAGQPFGLGDPGPLELHGPLVAVGAPAAPAPDDAFRGKLRALLNLPEEEPVVTPPVYGSWHAGQPTVPGDEGAPRWLRELNLDPAARAAAGLGARVVQERQDQLVSSAWAQLGDPGGVRALERRLDFGVAVLSSVLRRHVASMDAGRLLQLLGPAQARMRTSRTTLGATLALEGLPPSFTSAPLRRALRPAGSVARRRSAGPLSLQAVATRVRSWVAPVEPPPGTAGLVDPEPVRRQLATRPVLTPPMRRHRQALGQALDYVDAFGVGSLPAPRPPFRLDAELKAGLVAALEPRPYLRRRLYARVTSAGAAVAPPEQPGGTVLSQPSFPQPMYEALRDLSAELLLPGVGALDPNTVTVLQTNPRFIEAYMAGLNHEIVSELLWREFPGDLRHTYFRAFWDAGQAGTEQLADIRTWDPGAPLGGSLGAEAGQLVLLIRGELLRRHPDALIYAVPAQDATTLGDGELLPAFRGRIEPDITFVGFALGEHEARSLPPSRPGWFFVIQEQPSAPRFGLDETRTRPLATWNDLAWSDTRTAPGTSLRLDDLAVAAGERPDGPAWGFNAAHLAAILRQRPVRVAFHADRLLPPPRS